ncbi:MAG: class I SAM-dependent methyltransferase [Bacteroidota bacterium]
MVQLDQCPVCNSKEITNILTAKDYLVSGKEFNINSCSKCGLRFTNPRPNDKELGSYYDSEEYISHANESTSLVNSLYKIARSFTLGSKRRLVNNYAINKQILDVGCGTGHFLEQCKNHNWQVSGIEPNDLARNQANQLLNGNVYQDISEINNGEFEVITLWHVLEHLPDLNDTITQLKKRLQKKGTLIIAVPNYEAYEEKVFNEYWAAYDVPRHLYHFNQNSLKHLFEKHGLKVVETLPMWLDSFYISLLSNKQQSGRNKYIKSFITGLLSNTYAIKSKDFSSLIYIIRNLED